MRKILRQLGIVTMSTSFILSNIFSDFNIKQQFSTVNSTTATKLIKLYNKINDLAVLKKALDINCFNILSFKDKVGNIFFEDNNSIYILKKDEYIHQ